RAASAPSSVVREKALAWLAGQPSLARAEASTALLVRSMTDAAPGVRLLALRAAASLERFWDDAARRDALLARLIDVDSGVRAAALEVVEKRRLLPSEPRAPGGGPLARHVRALASCSDPKLAARAAAALREAGLAAPEVAEDVRLPQPAPLDYDFFKERVSRAFYAAARDGNGCANCHGTHALLRIVPPLPGGKPFSDAEVRSNYESALRVVDLEDRENS